jgi:hypothetical protein
VQASLALVGLRSTLRWIEAVEPASGSQRSGSRWGPRPRAPGRGAPPIGVAEASILVRGAFRAHVVRGECLPQSLVQYLLHRRDGLSVRFVVGVRRAGPVPPGHGAAIAAHAWIEDDSGTGDAVASSPTPLTPTPPAFAPLFVSGYVHSHPPERSAA